MSRGVAGSAQGLCTELACTHYRQRGSCCFVQVPRHRWLMGRLARHIQCDKDNQHSTLLGQRRSLDMGSGRHVRIVRLTFEVGYLGDTSACHMADTCSLCSSRAGGFIYILSRHKRQPYLKDTRFLPVPPLSTHIQISLLNLHLAGSCRLGDDTCILAY